MITLFPKKALKQPTAFEHIARKDVTDTLAHAMESADKMRHVIVIYETIESEDSAGGVISSDEVTLSKMNYLLDMGKKWIFD
jgi:hypothetical protein